MSAYEKPDPGKQESVTDTGTQFLNYKTSVHPQENDRVPKNHWIALMT